MDTNLTETSNADLREVWKRLGAKRMNEEIDVQAQSSYCKYFKGQLCAKPNEWSRALGVDIDRQFLSPEMLDTCMKVLAEEAVMGCWEKSTPPIRESATLPDSRQIERFSVFA